jgi:hypothetical protein
LEGVQAIYPIALTAVCVALSSVVWFFTWTLDPDPDSYITYDGPDLPSCGGAIAPIKYCYEADWFWKNSDASSKGIYMLTFCFLVMLCLIVDQIKIFPLRRSDRCFTSGGMNCFDYARAGVERWAVWERYERRFVDRRGSRVTNAVRFLHVGDRSAVLNTLRDFFLFAVECAFVSSPHHSEWT